MFCARSLPNSFLSCGSDRSFPDAGIPLYLPFLQAKFRPAMGASAPPSPAVEGLPLVQFFAVYARVPMNPTLPSKERPGRREFILSSSPPFCPIDGW